MLHCDVLNRPHWLFIEGDIYPDIGGFGDLYESISKVPYYKKNYESLNTEFLSLDKSKLGTVPLLLYKLLKLKFLTGSQKTPVFELFPHEVTSKMNFTELKKVVTYFSSYSSLELCDFCESVFNNHENDTHLLKILAGILELETYSFASFKSYILEQLYPNLIDSNMDEASSSIANILKTNVEELEKWYRFITDTQESDLIYHTYHGTKGREFNNVVIVMENDFGKMNKGIFSTFFKNIPNPTFGDDSISLAKHEKTKNLLYVSCSRARNNLRVIYIDPVTEFKTGIEYLFGEVEPYDC